MLGRRIANAVRLEFGVGATVCANLSGAAFIDGWLGVAGDETSSLVRLQRLEPASRAPLRYGAARSFSLASLLDLPAAADEEADLEGIAVCDGYLWVVGSHGLKRKKAKKRSDDERNAKRLSKLALDGNRRLLACLPIEHDADGAPCIVGRSQDGRRALRLKGGAHANTLTRLLADDPHFGAYMSIPGKDNGFDVEGLAVDGNRLLLGLRGPVIRGWSALLELTIERRKGRLRLAPFRGTGEPLRKHFLQLDGLGVRDLHFVGGDLYLLAGPTMVLDGEIRLYKWPGAKRALAANRRAARFEDGLVECDELPHGRGVDRAEALCDLPPELARGKPGWLVVYDSPGPERKDGDGTVYADLLRRA